MATRVVTVNRNTKPGVGPILLGHWITLKNLFVSLFGGTVTVQFPEQKRERSNRYRGIHILTQRQDGTPKCVACYMCATACPAECIHIEAGERPEAQIEKYPTRFEIDLLRCVYCGFCVDACPCEAIVMTQEYETAVRTREQAVIDKERLIDREALSRFGLGYRPRQ